MFLIELIGWVGSIIYILSYLLIAYNLIPKGKLYYLLNKIAAILVIIISVYKNTYQPIVINTIWLYISYLGYYKKEIQVSFLNKYIMYSVSVLFFITTFFFLLIDYKLAFDILAWFSVFSFSISYFLYSMNEIKEKIFHFYNFLAAISLIPKMLLFDNYQVASLELLWGFFALMAYVRSSKNRNYLIFCS